MKLTTEQLNLLKEIDVHGKGSEVIINYDDNEQLENYFLSDSNFEGYALTRSIDEHGVMIEGFSHLIDWSRVAVLSPDPDYVGFVGPELFDHINEWLDN